MEMQKTEVRRQNAEDSSQKQILIQQTSSPAFRGLYGPDNKLITTPTEIKKKPVKRAHVIRYFGYPADKQLLSSV